VVLNGFHIAPEVLAALRSETGVIAVNYATDDPFDSRTGTSELLGSILECNQYTSGV